MRIRIGYEDADSLLTYPRVNNLSVSMQPIRVASVSSVRMLIRLRELVLWIGSRPVGSVLSRAAAAAPWWPGAVVSPVKGDLHDMKLSKDVSPACRRLVRRNSPRSGVGQRRVSEPAPHKV